MAARDFLGGLETSKARLVFGYEMSDLFLSVSVSCSVTLSQLLELHADNVLFLHHSSES